MASLSSHLAKRLTRLSGLARSGTLVAMLGSWLLVLPTIPLMNTARRVKCWARRPLGSPRYHHFNRVSIVARWLENDPILEEGYCVAYAELRLHRFTRA